MLQIKTISLLLLLGINHFFFYEGCTDTISTDTISTDTTSTDTTRYHQISPIL